MKRGSMLVLAFAVSFLFLAALLSPLLSAEPAVPIDINGNGDLAAKAGENGWPGDGTAGDPYVIENKEIDAHGASHAISISYVSSHVLIKNCTFSNSAGSAVDLYYVFNLRFENNTVQGSDGVSLASSSGILIANSTLSGPLGASLTSSSNIAVINNSLEGLTGAAIAASSNVRVANNTISAGGTGIAADGSSGVILRDNGISSGGEAINLRVSSNNLIHNNTIAAAGSWGISLLDRSGRNTVSGNDLVNSTGGKGILVDRFCDQNVVIGNNCSGLSQPISLNFASGNKISGNNGSSSDVGISLTTSNDNEIAHNNFSDARIGVRVLTSHGSNVHNNTITGAGEYGILLSSSGSSSLADNNCSRSFRGVGLWSSSNNTISRLLVNDAGELGLYLSSSSGNNISNSVINNAKTGILLVSSRENIIGDNSFAGNGKGLELSGSSDSNEIRGNDLLGNAEAVVLSSSDRNVVAGNYITGRSTDGPGVTIGSGSLGNTFEDNQVFGYWIGLRIILSDGTKVSRNELSAGYIAILVEDSGEGIFRGNEMDGGSILLTGSRETFTTQTITVDNLVNGRPVHYIANSDLDNATVPSGAGEVILGNVSWGRVTGQILSDGTVGILIGYSNNITVDRNDLRYFHYGYGIRLESSNDCTITNNVASSNYFDIYLLRTHRNIIIDNDLDHAEVSIALVGSYQDIIRSNEIHGAGTGIMVVASEGSKVASNIVEGGETGIYVLSSDGSVLEDNAVSGAAAGLRLEGPGSSLVLRGTYENCGDGILVLDSSGNLINGTKATANENGIHLVGSTGNTIINADSGGNGYGLILHSSAGNFVIGSTFHDNAYVGISLRSSANNTIAGNKGNGNFDGIHLSGSDGNWLANNTLAHNNNGITLDGSDRNIITNNTAYSIRYGIYLTDSGENELRRNNCSDSYDGIYLLNSRLNVLEENLCALNDLYGIVLDGSPENVIRGNDLSANLNYGLGLLGSDGNIIEANHFVKNVGHAVVVESGRDNTIFNNTFEANNGGRIQAYDPTGSNHWSCGSPLSFGNHWSDWTGDADGDGFVDLPYRLAGGAVDGHPLAFPRLSVPGAPAMILVAAFDGTAELSWSVPDNGRSGIIRYNVYRQAADGAWIPAGTAAGPAFTDTGLTNWAVYRYRVEAVNLIGTGPWSDPLEAIPQAAPATAPEPVEVVKEPGRLSLAWNPVEGGTVHYIVLLNGVEVYRGPGTSTVLAELDNGTTYAIAIVACNERGSGPETSFEVSMLFKPDAPVNVAAANNTGAVTVTWDAPSDGGSGILHYNVYRAREGGAKEIVAAVKSLSCTDTALDRWTIYYYWVEAVNSVGAGPLSESADVITKTLPDQVGSVAVTKSSKVISLSWEPIVGLGVDHYIVLLNGVEVYNDRGTSVVLSGLTDGLVYSIEIIAYNELGPGPAAHLQVEMTFQHAPISIVGNAQFLSVAGQEGWTGKGTAADPIQIFGLLINARGSDHGIHISGTSLHFVIQDVLVEGAADSAIYLFNVQNGRVERTSLLDSGISVVSSSNIVLSQLSVAGSAGYGAYLSYSTDITIAESTFSGNRVGVGLWSSGGNTVSGSKIFDNRETGVELVSSSNNTLDALVVLNNRVGGVHFSSSRNNTVDNSRIEGSADGILVLSSSSGNTIRRSAISSNSFSGVKIIGSDRTVLQGNRFSDERYAVTIADSAGGVLGGNAMVGGSILLQGDRETFTTQTIYLNNTVNGKPVLYIKEGEQEMPADEREFGEIILGGVIGAIIEERNFDGVSVAVIIGYSADIVIRSSYFNDTFSAIFFQDSSASVDGVRGANSTTLVQALRSAIYVTDSKFSNNRIGISLIDCPAGRVSGNTFINNDAGVALNGTAGAFIEDNDFADNGMGVSLARSPGNTVRRNNFTRDAVGISISNSDGGIVEGNGFDHVGTGVLIDRSAGSKVLGNELRDGGVGIRILGSSGAAVSGNDARGNSVGIRSEGSSGTLIEDNTLLGNGVGILIVSGASELVHDNHAVGNTGAGIKVTGSSGIIVSGNKAFGGEAGISIESSAGVDLIGNEVADNDDGILITASSARLYRNIGHGNVRGLMISYGQDVIVEGDIYRDNQDGIHLFQSSGVEIRNATASDNYVGIILRWSDRNIIENATASSNNEYGLGLEGSDNNRINGSTLAENKNHGAGLKASDGNTFTNNTFLHNTGHAVYIVSGSENRFLNNAFFGNNVGGAQAYDDGSSNHWNTEGLLYDYGNHWSDQAGPDNGIGIVRDAYVLGGKSGAKDKHPLVCPYLRTPSAPLDLTFENGNGTVHLRWDPPAYTGSARVLNYAIYREHDGTIILVTVIGPQQHYRDLNLINGQDYAYWIIAINLLGEGLASDVVKAHPASPPYAPIDVTAVGDAATGNITLNWTAPADGGAGISGYDIYRGTGADDLSLLVESLLSTTYNDTTTDRGVRYYYVVVAKNIMGEGPRSAVINGTVPPLPPTAPRNLNAVASDSQVTLTWDAPESDGAAIITEYVIYRDGRYIGDATGLTYVDGTAKNGVAYSYMVKAKNSAGEGADSVFARATPATVPGAPTDLKPIKFGATVVLSWKAPKNNGGSSVSDYNIYRGTSSTNMVLIGSSDGERLYYDSTAAAGVVYQYMVRAVNSVGEGESSTTVEEKNSMPLEGKVVDADGKGVANATITIDGKDYATDREGRFVAEVIPGEGKSIAIIAPGMKDLAQEVDVTIWAEELGTFEMEADSSENGDIMNIIWIPIVGAAAVVGMLVFSRVLRQGRKSGQGSSKDRKRKR